MTQLRAWLASRTGRLVTHDAALAAAAGVTAWQAAGGDWTWGAFTAAGVVAAKAFLRLLLPVPGASTISHQQRSGLQAFVQLPPPRGPQLGAKPKPHDPRDLELAQYTLSYKAPASIHWGAKIAAWGMLLNDRLGDCTIAGALHAIMCWLANVGHPISFGDPTALALYERVDGYNPNDPNSDQGGVLRNVLKYWKATGLSGHKVLAYVAVDPTNHDEMKQAIATFGCVYIGVDLPLTAQAQGVHWTKETGPDAAAGTWGGHCIIYTGYTSQRLDTVTWGQQGTATWGFNDAYCSEAWAVISPDWMNAAGIDPAGLDLAQLEADLKAV